MKDLLEKVIKWLVEKPNEVKISQVEENPGIVLFKIKVHSDDKKIIIGKNGKTINALRNLLKIKAIKEQKKFNLELEE